IQKFPLSIPPVRGGQPAALTNETSTLPLPPDVFIRTFKYLDHKSLVSVCLTGKTLYSCTELERAQSWQVDKANNIGNLPTEGEKIDQFSLGIKYLKNSEVPPGFKGKVACALASQVMKFQPGSRSRAYREILSLIGSKHLSDRDSGKVLSALATQVTGLPDADYFKNFQDLLDLRGILAGASQLEMLSRLAREIPLRPGHAKQIATAVLNAGLQDEYQTALFDVAVEQMNRTSSDQREGLFEILSAALFVWSGGEGEPPETETITFVNGVAQPEPTGLPGRH
ncbi:MAG: hypothetical protein JWQ23_4047, partial [Herminiimonas sp.]|nr:hypothetical protein [Herminiimonas sp.]